MNKIIILSGLFITSLSLKAQSNQLLWKSINETEISVTGKRDIQPEKYKTFHVNIISLKNILANTPLDKDIITSNSNAVISLPMPDGSIQDFRITESPVMEESLQISFPEIRTYNIRGIDDVYASGKLDLTEFGFHGMIRSPKGDVYIDPYCKWNTTDYISYYTADFSKPLNERGVCEGTLGSNYKTMAPNAICAGANLKTYRLAIACTGEYARAACGTGTNTPTTSQILAKVVTSVNRVDGVYETEVAVKLVLVPTTTVVLFGVPGQGFTTAENNNANTLISKSQSIITSSVGAANFDIGHTFSTGGGGLAQLGCVCSAGSKASGITGSPSPVGDPYDIDYVAHEMGHQFGGNHTFNGNGGSCSGNRNASTAVEPGSGVTIMAYAGICSPQDLAPNSIAYFQGVSYDEITNFINTGGGNNCDVMTATGNAAPSVSVNISSIAIPKGTPFQLTGSATDPNGDALTYQWEEVDAGTVAGNWNTGTKPFFRSYVPVTTPTRLFPKLANILAGTYTTSAGEFLPGAAGTTFTANATLKFRLTARDNKIGGGGVCSALTTLTISSAAGPFAVSSQSTTGIIYPSGSTQTINWNVNNTNVAPVNCLNVNIYVSTDNGNTFTLSIANTPNDGTENIILPSVAVTKTTCRVKVESVGNIFFDVNKKMFTISAATGISAYSNSNSLTIQLYPNPFSGSVKVDINATNLLDDNKTVILVYDVLGNIVRSENIKLTENFSKVYDFSSLANGSYIVVVTDGKQKSVARLIKL